MSEEMKNKIIEATLSKFNQHKTPIETSLSVSDCLTNILEEYDVRYEVDRKEYCDILHEIYKLGNKEEHLKLYIRQLKRDIENEDKEPWNGGYKLTRLSGELSGVKKTLSVLGIDLKEYEID